MSPSSLLPTPSLLAFWQGSEETALLLCKHCSAMAKTLLCCQHHSSYKHKAQHCRSCYSQLPSQPDPVQQVTSKCWEILYCPIEKQSLHLSSCDSWGQQWVLQVVIAQSAVNTYLLQTLMVSVIWLPIAVYTDIFFFLIKDNYLHIGDTTRSTLKMHTSLWQNGKHKLDLPLRYHLSLLSCRTALLHILSKLVFWCCKVDQIMLYVHKSGSLSPARFECTGPYKPNWKEGSSTPTRFADIYDWTEEINLN